ncbi:hypothetical protein SAMN02745221_02070 [Thermosyntropha lipolytica DSM 11003]|uniref:CRISPR-associated protein, Cmr3 family n=1 Tax=Thermosyntropha lipolytica DSM 11003 TaxID=1123382 RepID=A0A1M5RNJ2_9FIRM|nr:hypothetical protein [Thermosyntropha lipolytica]SHH27720.1 hypothetical protein SAMN02745221_02070 [Thermosyntropha lipolytica DSM 11003]
MKWFKLVFRQKQPLHIGSFRWGVIAETGIFIPGWTMWGALTDAFLRRESFARLDESEKHFAAVTSFYPALLETGSTEKEISSLEPMFPLYKKGRFYLGGKSEAEFRFYFTDLLMSTAVEGISRKAWDMSLHEIEYILPCSRKNRSGEKIFSLYWIGLIGLEDEKIFSFIPRLIYAGGERRYGMGEMELVLQKEVKNDELALWNLDGEGNLHLERAEPLKNFLPLEENVCLQGETALLVELNFRKSVPEAEKAGHFVKPGSLIKNPEAYAGKKYVLQKGKFVRV